MKLEENVYEIWKELGETPLEALSRLRDTLGLPDAVKMTYAGRLDPMAEGVMHILVGDAVNNKKEYMGLDKEYEVEVLVGFKTDTGDLLGLIENSSINYFDINKVKEYCLKNIGKINQKYSKFSSKTVNGKSLFTWAREGKIDDIEIPTHEVEIYDIKVDDYIEEVSGSILLKDIEERVLKVRGDFRQDETLSRWNKGVDMDKEYLKLKIKMKVSSGTYVRQFISDMSEELDYPLSVYSIKRTKVISV